MFDRDFRLQTNNHKQLLQQQMPFGSHGDLGKFSSSYSRNISYDVIAGSKLNLEPFASKPSRASQIITLNRFSKDSLDLAFRQMVEGNAIAIRIPNYLNALDCANVSEAPPETQKSTLKKLFSRAVYELSRIWTNKAEPLDIPQAQDHIEGFLKEVQPNYAGPEDEPHLSVFPSELGNFENGQYSLNVFFKVPAHGGELLLWNTPRLDAQEVSRLPNGIKWTEHLGEPIIITPHKGEAILYPTHVFHGANPYQSDHIEKMAWQLLLLVNRERIAYHG